MRPGVDPAPISRRPGLKYELERLVQEVRIGDLCARLTNGEIAVRATSYRRSGRRVHFALDDGSALSLRLFWPRREAVGAILSMRYDEEIGWIVVTRTAAGGERIFYAWLAIAESANGR